MIKILEEFNSLKNTNCKVPSHDTRSPSSFYGLLLGGSLTLSNVIIDSWS